MPELPEVEALAHHLRRCAVGHQVARVDVASMTVLKTVSPSPAELLGHTVTVCQRARPYSPLVTTSTVIRRCV